MVKYGLVQSVRTEKGYLSFNDMGKCWSIFAHSHLFHKVLQKFINDFGSEFISKPPAKDVNFF